MTDGWRLTVAERARYLIEIRATAALADDDDATSTDVAAATAATAINRADLDVSRRLPSRRKLKILLRRPASETETNKYEKLNNRNRERDKSLEN